MLSKSDAQRNVCLECGAPVSAGASYKANFHTLLALEWDIPGGPGEIADFFCVAAYGIQHPDSMGYSQAAVDGLVGAVRDVLDGCAAIADIRKRVREHVASVGRVTRRDDEAVPVHEVKAWSIVVTDIIAGGVEGYQEQVERWARSVVETLDSSTR